MTKQELKENIKSYPSKKITNQISHRQPPPKLQFQSIRKRNYQTSKSMPKGKRHNLSPKSNKPFPKSKKNTDVGKNMRDPKKLQPSGKHKKREPKITVTKRYEKYEKVQGFQHTLKKNQNSTKK